MERDGQLEARVAALEEEVARIKSARERERGTPQPWWERIAGTFAHDRPYKKAMLLGKQYRHSQASPAVESREARYGRARHRPS